MVGHIHVRCARRRFCVRILKCAGQPSVFLPPASLRCARSIARSRQHPRMAVGQVAPALERAVRRAGGVIGGRGGGPAGTGGGSAGAGGATGGSGGGATCRAVDHSYVAPAGRGRRRQRLHIHDSRRPLRREQGSASRCPSTAARSSRILPVPKDGTTPMLLRRRCNSSARPARRSRMEAPIPSASRSCICRPD